MNESVTDQRLEVVTVEPSTSAKACVIWLHGLGADGHDFAPIVPQLDLDALGVRFVFPHAPHRTITINGGAVMRGWFDIGSFDVDATQDETAIRDSATAVESLIAEQEATGIARENIVVAGFSQGGAIAIHYGLRATKPIAGILALSTFLPLHKKAPSEVTACGQSLPLFYAHGELDPLVTLELAELSCSELRAMGVDVDWRSYPMAHQVCPQEITDISEWLKARFN